MGATGSSRTGRWARAAAAALLGLAPAMMLLSSGAPGAARASEVDDEAAFVASTQALRASLGLPPFAVDGELTAIARRWSAGMAAARDIWHNPGLPGQVSPGRWVTLNENVGTGPGVSAVHAALLSSPGHRSNLVNPRYTHIGIGVTRVGNVVYVTQVFARSAAAESTGATAAPSGAGAAAATRRRAPVTAPAATASGPAGAPRSAPTARLALVLEQVRALGV